MTTIQYVCLGCGRLGTVYTRDAQDAPTGWYRISRSVRHAYACSWACVIALGPTLHRADGHGLPQPAEVRR